MKKTLSLLPLGLLLTATAAEMTEAERARIEAKLAGTYNPLSLADGRVVVDAQERLRAEYRENNIRFNDGVDKDTDEWLLQRFRVGLTLKPVPTIKAQVQLQDAREFGSTRVSPIGDANLEEADLDLRQAWVELGDPAAFPLTLKLGRQELVYGDERLIGSFDWNNVGRVFDGAKLRYQQGKTSVDAFAANVVLNNVFARRQAEFDDTPDTADDFYGLYGVCAVPKTFSAEAYALLRDKGDAEYDGPAREIWTLGTRLKTTPRLAPWDAYGEFAWQGGEITNPGVAANRRFGENSTNSVTDHVAYAFVVGGGYTWVNHTMQPRLGLEYNEGSGDEDPADGENNTFENLFPTNHKFYGFMDLFAWKNLRNPRAVLTVQATPKLKLQLDANRFYLAEDKDLWYRANGAPAAPGRRNAKGLADGHIGDEIDLTFWYVVSKKIAFHGGVGYFMAGDFVADTAGGETEPLNGDDDALFGYAQAMFSF